ncbi:MULTISPECIES: hypothetical protein [Staphylococcus]|uniref:Uncharacterized protein n=2 Tax=Staphylococcus pettenkoferi TaxID=170573 RepID=A0A2N6QD84_9STAP|nr:MULTISPECIES: hypothetical protein [Staphylococcus]MCI2791681.1 hypothetical protein [Staphylococcus pettenkoferi]OFK76960.1 hypothetical protein HMPREF2802_09745 [Staphylococcus sp. HMSC071G07]PMC17495.1 hypothetical protein CJ235_10815 [Staphylococcus pettenkoferi]
MKLVSKVLGSTILTGAVLFTGMQAGQANAEEEHYSQVTDLNAPFIAQKVLHDKEITYLSEDYHDGYHVLSNYNNLNQKVRVYQDGTVKVADSNGNYKQKGQYKLTPKFSKITKGNAPEIIKYYTGEIKHIGTSDKGDYIEASAINSQTTATHYRLYKDGTLRVSNNGAGAPPFKKIGKFPLKNNQ